MVAATNGGAKKGGKTYKVLAESLKEACPGWKLKELDGLVREMKGDEVKCRQKIAEWWDQGEPVAEEQWEDVNKKHGKKKEIAQGGSGPQQQQQFNRGRGGRGGEGRGRGRAGGRGDRAGDAGGRGGRGRGVGGAGGRGRGRSQYYSEKPHDVRPVSPNDTDDIADRDLEVLPTGVPANVRIPQGAWGTKQQTTPETAASDGIVSVEALVSAAEPVLAPTPDPIAPPPSSGPKPVARPAGPAGNVWATKGSAHLIQAEKPKPPAPAAPKRPVAPAVEPTPPTPIKQEFEPELVEPEPEVIEEVIAPSPCSPVPVSPTVEPQAIVMEEPRALTPEALEPTCVWGTGPPAHVPEPDPEPEEPASPEPPVPPSPILKPIGVPVADPPAPADSPVIPEPVPQPPAPVGPPSVLPKQTTRTQAPPPSVLNMGRWDAGAGDEDIDFGFGAFGGDSAETGSLDATTTSNSTNNVSQAPSKESSSAPPATAPSPARPPPGLSIGGGMRPIPADAVLVHELENKLEEASLANAAVQQSVPEPPAPAGLPSQPVPAPEAHPVHTNPMVHPEPSLPVQPTAPYSQHTGMGMGMYSYGAPGAFMSMPGAPSLGNALHTKPPMGGPLGPAQLQHGGLYNTGPTSQPQQHASAPSSGNAPNTVSNDNSNNSNQAPASGLPPGMAGIPYQAPLYYNQQQHMGQYPPYYPFNTFGGVAQGGFYPPSMGHSGGYGNAPHYEDQSGSHQGSGGYQKNQGGFRGRGSHHNNNQYQNPFPQSYGGGQPYSNMGYHSDYGRGGYSQPGGMQDHYMPPQQPQQPQQQGQIGGFQPEDQYGKSKKGGGPRGGGGGYQQFGGPPPHLSQQPFGLQGAQGAGGGSDANPSSGTSGGWPNQASGGWGGGSPSWQGK